MSRSLIFSEQFTDPPLIDALREHREDRAVLLHALITSFENDPRIRAAWLWGSFGRDQSDDLSDLDPWLIVTDEAVAELGSRLHLYAEQAGSFISGREAPQNAPPGGGYFSSLHEGRHGLLHLDCYWQPVSAMGALPEYAILFNRLDEPSFLPQVSLKSEGAIAVTEIDEQIKNGLGFAWLMFSIAAKYLARDPDSDMGLMFYPKPGLEETAALIGWEGVFRPEDWTVPEDPLEKVARLRHLVRKTDKIRLAAEAQGCIVSPLYAACLLRYLAMIESILKVTAK